MVAIPSALLASSIISNLGPLANPLNAAVKRHEQAVRKSEASAAFATVIGPVVDLNFPDPAIIHVDGVSYAFATNNRGVGGDMIHVQMASSTDNTTWSYFQGQDALPESGAWATGNRVWAPDVIQLVREPNSIISDS